MSIINGINKLNSFKTNFDLNSNSKKHQTGEKDPKNKKDNDSKNTQQDSFVFKSNDSFGAYSKASLTSTTEELVEENVVTPPEEEVSKGMDISKLTGKDYTKSNGKIDVEQMKTDQLVNFQNMIQKMINNLADEDGKIPTRVQQAAQASLEGEGYWSPESVSTRILDMAKALSGGDPSKFELLKDAVIKGFEGAEESWGSKLPSITETTFDLVMQGFDDWFKELNPSTEALA